MAYWPAAPQAAFGMQPAPFPAVHGFGYAPGYAPGAMAAPAGFALVAPADAAGVAPQYGGGRGGGKGRGAGAHGGVGHLP